MEPATHPETMGALERYSYASCCSLLNVTSLYIVMLVFDEY